MTEISTPVKNSSCVNETKPETSGEGELCKEDERLLLSIGDGLYKLSKSPRNSTLKSILSYSRSFKVF